MSRLLRLPPRRIRPVSSVSRESLDEQISGIFGQIMSEIQSMEDVTLRDLWMDAVNTFISSGDTDGLEKVTRWRRPVVSLDEFLFGDAFLGIDEKEVYPGVLKMLEETDDDRYDEIVSRGALGIGKTFGANIKLIRDLYKISCMRNPQQTYGLAKGTPIAMTIQSVRLRTAQQVVFGELGRMLKTSPYFSTKFPFNPLITSQMIFPEFNIRIVPIATTGTGVISMNVIAGQLDEMNFMQKTLKSKSSQADEKGMFDQAIQLYNTLASRRKSRFNKRGSLPGALYLISSARFPDDFTERKAAEAEMCGGSDPRIFVFGGSQWEIKGADKFSDEYFKVQVGNETYPSKVLKEGEEPNRGCEVIDVPMDFYQDFVRDTDGGIRDFAGRTTLSTAPFFSQREKIAEAVELASEHGYMNPMSLEEAELSIGLPDLDRRKVRNDVKQPRYAHVDLGITQDACGLAVGHLAGHRVKEFINEDTGNKEIEILPVIAYDVILRIIQPLGGEIQLEDVRKFLRKLNTKYKLGIETVTFDGFQSVDSRQLLAKQGFKVGKTSVEAIEPWRTFRDALYDGRILLVGHNFLNTELSRAERVVTPGNKEKVDHPASGTKDVADAVVGVAANIFRKRITWANMRQRDMKPGVYLFGSKTKAGVNVSTPSEKAPARASDTRRRSMERRSLTRR